MLIVKQWFAYHNLFLNVDKTKVLPFSINKTTLPSITSVKIHDFHNCPENCTCSYLEIVHCAKYLGIEIDCHLRWEKHITYLIKRLRRLIYPFLSLRKFLGLPTLKEVYYALAQSALEYGICAYGRADKTILAKLNVVQNLLLKLIYKKERRFPTINLYNDLKVLNLEKLYQKNICSHIHQHKDKLINYKEVPYSLRKTNIIERPKCKTTKGQKYIMYVGLGLYNKLPHEIKIEDKAQNFKYKLKDWLCKNDLSSG